MTQSKKIKLDSDAQFIIDMFIERKHFKTQNEVISAALELLMESQLEKESKIQAETYRVDDDIMMLQFECMNRNDQT